jgi:inner membrane transporter RhtA
MAEAAMATGAAGVPPRSAPATAIPFRNAPPELFFIVSAVAQYSGAVIAKKLFTEVDAGTVAWFRVATAAVALIVFSRAWTRRWDRAALKSAALFGIATAAMNLFFYLAIQRINLGIGVAVEFIGPISVAAARTRTGRNWIALALATSGVLVLAGLQFKLGEPLGLFFMLCASACWAAYIVLGSRMAKTSNGLAGLGVGLLMGMVVIAPFGLSDTAKVFASPRLLVLCACVGMFSSAIAYGVDQLTMKHISPRRFAVLSALLPVTAVLAGLLFLGESLSALDVVGISLVVIAVVVQERDGSSGERTTNSGSAA